MIRDGGVGLFVDDVGADGVALLDGELLERAQKRVVGIGRVDEGLDALECRVGDCDRFDAEPRERAALDAPALASAGEQVASDPEQPWQSALVFISESARAGDGGGERFGGQFGREVSVAGASHEEAGHDRLVADVERGKRVAVTGGGAAKELTVAGGWDRFHQ